ncbi:hypothetical protein D9619_010670 [Psilocybe cf. subviscida]|uniref:ATP-dependent DNA helicase n=1 Tax=Psilocybe cf. subviscida TaxID=2480587 RepID=A0A8H5B8E2_9AGAR|nr:hypothetical protein D9619_010670 [Psilocybe cf. subviscida]
MPSNLNPSQLQQAQQRAADHARREESTGLSSNGLRRRTVHPTQDVNAPAGPSTGHISPPPSQLPGPFWMVPPMPTPPASQIPSGSYSNAVAGLLTHGSHLYRPLPPAPSRRPLTSYLPLPPAPSQRPLTSYLPPPPAPSRRPLTPPTPPVSQMPLGSYSNAVAGPSRQPSHLYSLPLLPAPSRRPLPPPTLSGSQMSMASGSGYALSAPLSSPEHVTLPHMAATSGAISNRQKGQRSRQANVKLQPINLPSPSPGPPHASRASRPVPIDNSDSSGDNSSDSDDSDDSSDDDDSPWFMMARRPRTAPIVPHDLGRMDIECLSCHALHWDAERLSSSSKKNPRFGMCCSEGKVRLPMLEPPPEPLTTLLTANTPEAKHFREVNWKYNRALAFTSVGVKEDPTVNTGRGQPVFRISGELYHYSGALTPPEGQRAQFAQVYLYDPVESLDIRMANNVQHNLKRTLMEDLQHMLNSNHSYVPIYKHAYEILQNQDPANDVQVRLRVTPQMDRRRYNLPTANEVAVILPGHEVPTEPRDIILRFRDGALHRISDLHPAYVPLQYPLLFPRGENGWYPQMMLTETEEQQEKRLNARNRRRMEAADNGVPPANAPAGSDDPDDTRKLTLCRYTAYRLQNRQQERGNALIRGGRLFARYIVDMFASIDQQRLSYIYRNQGKFRLARLSNLQDVNMRDPDNHDLHDIGQRVFLPSSFTGGPRYMSERYQDAMAIARQERRIDAFVTMTANPHWKEVTRELEPGQTAYDRPDLVARVFQLKLKELLNLICKKGIFGKVAAYVYTIEFQKRGLPHAHIIIFFKNRYKLRSPEDIDSCISAEWPDPDTQPALFDVVKSCMVHGPCGPLNPKAPCMVNGKCSKGFPKPYTESTTTNGNGYPLYRRRDDGRAYNVGGKMVTNQYIVPYSPFLSEYFECHINFECPYSFSSVKYIFKYVHKGPDRGALEIERKDEVATYVDGRYISAPDAAWRIFQFPIHHSVPNVIRLQIHLEGEQVFMFDPDDDLENVIETGIAKKTTLTAFFAANADDGPLGEEARKHTYQEFPRFFTYCKSKRKWSLRSSRGQYAIGRIYFIKPTAGELFYLRTLLSVVKGPKSFQDLRVVPGVNDGLPLPTFHAACLARGLLQDDGEWRICLREASQMHTGTRLRFLFATLLRFCDVSQPDTLWIEFREHICDDLEHQLRKRNVRNIMPDLVYDYGLYLLEQILLKNGHALSNWPSMPRSQQPWSTLIANSLITEQLNYDTVALHDTVQANTAQFNPEQLNAYQQIVDDVLSSTGSLFFLNGPGGTGKTFVYNTVCARLRSEQIVVLCVSSSGISALLIDGGRTAHSMFRIPVDNLLSDSFCAIPKNSDRADLMRATRAIIWDEVSAQHRHAIEAVDRTLRDLRNCSGKPFGGITTILGGDFLQTMPVVPHGSREDTVDASIQRSALWQHVKVLKLHKNMRLESGDAAPDAPAFAAWLLDVGHGRSSSSAAQGTGGHPLTVNIPASMRVCDENALITSIYPGIGDLPIPSPEYFAKRMILAPRNADVRQLNEDILALMDGDPAQFLSADRILQEEGADPADAEPVPTEVLRSIEEPGSPPGVLNLKIGCPVILLRNLDPPNGLCNGTRLVVTKMAARVIEGRILGGRHNGSLVMIPRIAIPSSSSSAHTFRFLRIQFPLRLSFALSINKSQGQSVRHVGIFLSTPVFSHGQLYVALSRATSKENVKVLLSEESPHSTDNIVYNEILL